MARVSVHLLNHASAVIDVGGVRILTDPWFMGTCFENGWGLRYENPEAWEHAAACDYLWISHFHPDHFHVPTLKRLLGMNPKIKVLGNASFNFRMDEAMRSLGFANVVTLEERVPMRLGKEIEVTRFPATGIDNMLLIRTPDAVILDYNDCVIPDMAKRALARRFGRIDLFLCNFNHAGKLLKAPVPSDEDIRKSLLSNFRGNVRPFDPRCVIPFASHHYYRAEESLNQNTSLLDPEDLARAEPRVVPARVGETVDWDPVEGRARIREQRDPVAEAQRGMESRTRSYTVAELAADAEAFAARLRKAYPLLTRLLPPLRIRLEGVTRGVSFHPRYGLREDRDGARPHISAHSESVRKWMTKPYGTDGFIVGAHFRLEDPDRSTLMRYVIAGMLMDNRLDARSLLRMLIRPKGLAFFWNRREEILGILLSGQISSEYQR